MCPERYEPAPSEMRAAEEMLTDGTRKMTADREDAAFEAEQLAKKERQAAQPLVHLIDEDAEWFKRYSGELKNMRFEEQLKDSRLDDLLGEADKLQAHADELRQYIEKYGRE